MTKLKRCPFCGGKAEKKVFESSVFYGQYVEIGCPKCNIWFKERADVDKSATECATEKWNRRA